MNLKVGKAVNRFRILEDNPDLRPEQVEEIINIPEENKRVSKTSADEAKSKTISFERFQTNIQGLDYKRSLLQNFRNFIKQSQDVALPREVDPEDYYIYYTTSYNETNIVLHKNVMQTNFKFPFAFFNDRLQQKMLGW